MERPQAVEPGKAEGERRVQVEVRVDEGRRDEPPGGVDLLGRAGRDPGGHLRDAPVQDGDIDAPAAVGQRGVSEG